MLTFKERTQILSSLQMDFLTEYIPVERRLEAFRVLLAICDAAVEQHKGHSPSVPFQ